MDKEVTMFLDDFLQMKPSELEGLTELNLKSNSLGEALNVDSEKQGKLLVDLLTNDRDNDQLWLSPDSFELKIDIFCKNLYGCKNLLKIDFSYNGLGDLKTELFIKLFMVLGCINFLEINISNNKLHQLNPSTLGALSYFFTNNRNLQRVNLAYNKLGDLSPECFMLLSSSLQKCSALRHINLAGNQIFNIYPRHQEICYEALLLVLVKPSIDLNKCISKKDEGNVYEDKLIQLLKNNADFASFVEYYLIPQDKSARVEPVAFFERFCEIIAKIMREFSLTETGKELFKNKLVKGQEDPQAFRKGLSYHIKNNSKLRFFLYSKNTCLRALERCGWNVFCETLSGFKGLEFIDLSGNKKSPILEFFDNTYFSFLSPHELLNKFTFFYHITLLFNQLSKCESLVKVGFEGNHLFEYPPDVLEELCDSFVALPQGQELNLGKLTCLPSPQFETLYNWLSTSRYTLTISQLNTAKDDQRVVLISSLLQKRQEAFLALSVGLHKVPNLVKQIRHKILTFAFQGYLNPDKIPVADNRVTTILNKKGK